MSDQPKTKKVRLMIESEVDEAGGFTDEEYAKIAVGFLTKIMAQAAGECTEERGITYFLVNGMVSYQKPKPLLGAYDVIEGDGGVYLLDCH